MGHFTNDMKRFARVRLGYRQLEARVIWERCVTLVTKLLILSGIIGIIYFLKNHRHPADNTNMIFVRSSPKKHLETVKDLYKLKSKVSGVLPVDDEEMLEQVYDRTYGWGKRRRLPHALVIGIQGCGPKLLTFYMQSHPNVVSNINDVNFFAMDFLYDMGYNWYRLRMPPSEVDQIVLSRGAFHWDTVGVPERVFTMKKDIKIIVVICDPTKRILRWYENELLQAKEREENFPSIEDVIFDHKNQSLMSNHRIVKGGRFSENYKNWLKLFKPEQFLFINGTNLYKNPIEEITRLEVFLGLPPKVSGDDIFSTNSTNGPCRRTLEGTHECMKYFTKRRPDFNLTVDLDTIAKLQSHYRPHNKHFYDITGLNVT